jgi:hypothetical protein
MNSDLFHVKNSDHVAKIKPLLCNSLHASSNFRVGHSVSAPNQIRVHTGTGIRWLPHQLLVEGVGEIPQSGGPYRPESHWT